MASCHQLVALSREQLAVQTQMLAVADPGNKTAEIEARCVHMLGDLWNSPAKENAVGCSTTGSSEAVMLGGMAMKRRWEASRKAAGKPIDKPNLITGPVQSLALLRSSASTRAVAFAAL